MKIFFDSSVLIAALLSSSGASGQLIHLCEGGFLEGYISSEIYEETLKVIHKKFPYLAPGFKSVVEGALRLKKISNKKLSKEAVAWIKDPNDVMVLVGAKILNVDILLTLDIKDFISDPKVAQKAKLRILTPGDFLKWFNENGYTDN